MGHRGRDGRWIECDPSGHCRWIAHTSVAAARLRLFEASRGQMPRDARLESTCGDARCVNLDHIGLVRRTSSVKAEIGTCRRGHRVIAANVVRHRDGRIAYCRLCRNERRRERYVSDSTFARAEKERQRLRRKRKSVTG